MATIHVKDLSHFDELIGNNKLVIVDYYADWCGPCRMMAPVFETMSEEYSDIAFLKVDTEAIRELSQRYVIQSIPTVQAFVSGEIVIRFAGFDKNRLKKSLDTLRHLEETPLADFNGVKLVEEEAIVLKELEKAGNKIFVPLDKEEGDWKFSATALHVDNIELSKVDKIALLDSLEKLTDLKSLLLTEMNLKTLPTVITRLKSLMVLDLSKNNLSDLPTAIENLENLLGLSLEVNNFNRVPDAIKGLENLRGISLAQNKLDELPEFFNDLQNIERLDLGQNAFSSFPNVLFNLKKLEVLGFAKNGLKILPEDINKIQRLQYLDVSNNNLTTLPQSLLETHIIKIDVEGNSLDEKGNEIVQAIEAREMELMRRYMQGR